MSEAKERPLCRKAIEDRGLKPHIEKGVWDGFTGVHPDGRVTSLSDGMSKQMRLMVAEGCWGEVKLERWRRW